MKKLLVVLALLVVSCSNNIEKASIEDCGKKEIGKGLYLKKINVGGDRVYMLVDENDKLINGNTASSHTVYQSTGKATTTRVESNSFINP